MERAALVALFGQPLAKSEPLMQLALSYLKLYALTPDDLSNHWEAYVLARPASSSSATVFNLDNLIELGAQIAATRGTAGAPKLAKSEGVKVKAAATRGIGKGGMDSLYSLATPAKPNRGGAPSSSPHSSLVGTPYARAQQGGMSKLKSSPAALSEMSSPVVSSAIPFNQRPASAPAQDPLNSHLPLAFPSSATTSRIMLSSTADPTSYNYRYMYERMMERSEKLDSIIDEAADTLKHWFGIEEYGDPSVQSQEDIIAIGRLCSETDIAKLTDTSTWLESSRSLGAGSRVLLKFEPDMKVRGAPVGSGGMGIFPGCVAGVRGRNGGGKVFSVSEIMMLPQISPTFTRPSQLLNYQYGTGPRQAAGNPLSVFVANGPYTTDLNLDYEPLAALMEILATEKPDLVILIGPFVDANHPLIKKGNVDSTPTEIFIEKFSKKLARLLRDALATAVILVPSVRDLMSHHVTFPQGPLAREGLSLPKGVKLLPNPTTFSVNEVVFSVTSVDVLFHLQNQTLFKRCAEVSQEGDPVADEEEIKSGKDVIGRACRHLLRQRSFYPLFPAPQVPGGEILNLDVTHNELIRMSAGADVVILPSMLKHFVKTVDSTVFVNPSFLTRGGAAGTFARLTIHPLPKEELERRVVESSGVGEGEMDEETEHRVFERCRVDILRI